MRRIKPDRTEDRQQVLIEIFLQPLFLSPRPLTTAKEIHALPHEFWNQHIIEHPVLFFDQRMATATDG